MSEAIPYFETAQTKIGKFRSPFKAEQDIDDYTCPDRDERDSVNWVSIGYCEGKGRGQGCEDIKTCEAYEKQKRMQLNHPEIDWERPYRTNKTDRIRIEFIKKGAIIEK